MSTHYWHYKQRNIFGSEFSFKDTGRGEGVGLVEKRQRRPMVNSPFLDFLVELVEDGFVLVSEVAVVEATDEVDLIVQLVVESADDLGQSVIGGHDGVSRQSAQ